MAELHSQSDNELEKKDQTMFRRAVVLAGIAILIILTVALMVVRRVGRHISPVNPGTHTTSYLHNLPDNGITPAGAVRFRSGC